MLGYDGDAAPVAEARSATIARRARAPAARLFADLCALGAAAPRRRAASPACAARRSTCTRYLALARRRGRGAAARASSSASRRALAHYGVDDPRPHARARGRPATGSSSPSSARRARARRRARDPRPPPRARRPPQPATTSARCSTARRRPPPGRDPIVADLAREVRFRCFDEPLIAAARDARLRRDGGAPRGAGRRARAPGPRRAGRARSSTARGRWRRCCCGGWPAAEPALRRVLLETWRAATTASARSSGFAELATAAGPLLCARYRHDGTRRRLATAFVDLAGLAAARERFAAWAAAAPAGDLAVADFYAARRRATRRARRGCARSSPTVALPASVHRIVVARRAGRGGRGMSAIGAFTFRPGADGLVEDEVAARPAPDDGRAPATSGGSASSRSSGCRRPRTSTCSAAAAARTRRTSGCSRSPRCATSRPVRDEEGRVVALPELERMLVEALEGIRRFQARRTPSAAAALEPRPALRLADDRAAAGGASRALVERLAPQTAGARHRDGGRPRPNLRDGAHGARPRCCASSRPAGRGVVVEVDDPPTQPLQPLDEGARRVVAARRRGHRCTRPRSSSCSRPHGRSSASSSSTTSTPRVGSSPVDRPAATQHRGHRRRA